MTSTHDPDDRPDNRPQGNTDEPRDDTSAFGDAAAWMARVVARAVDPLRTALPGIISPLGFTVDFAENSQADVVSITMGNGRARLATAAADGSSGHLHLKLRWSPGFRAHGLELHAVQEGGWTVDALDDTAAELTRPALSTDSREVVLPQVSVLKTAGPDDNDEFIARLWGEAADCRGASVRGWSRA